jgi:hypothetical protein
MVEPTSRSTTRRRSCRARPPPYTRRVPRACSSTKGFALSSRLVRASPLQAHRRIGWRGRDHQDVELIKKLCTALSSCPPGCFFCAARAECAKAPPAPSRVHPPITAGRRRVAEKSTFAGGAQRVAACSNSSNCGPEALLRTFGGRVRHFLRRSLRAGRRVLRRDIAVTRAEGAQTRHADKFTRALRANECVGGAARPTSAPTTCIPRLHGRLKEQSQKASPPTRQLARRERVDDTARQIKHQRRSNAQRAPRRASRDVRKGRSKWLG